MTLRPASASSRRAWGSMDQGQGAPGGVANPAAQLDDDDALPTAMESELYGGAGPGAGRPGQMPGGGQAGQAAQPAKPKTAWGSFKRGIRSIWATRQTEETENNKELHIKTTLRELVIYIVFLVILCIITFGMTSSTMFYFTNVLNTLFILTPGDPTQPLSTYLQINCPNDWMNFAKQLLIPGVYTNWESWYNGQNLTGDSLGYIFYENKLQGMPRLRQLRVRNDSCTVAPDFVSTIPWCFGPYSKKAEDHTPFGAMGPNSGWSGGPSSETAWTYQTSEQLDGMSYTAQVSSYEGGGYVQDLKTNSANSMAIIADLQNYLWIDRATRVVFVDFTVYNANINLFCVIKLVVEFPASGGAVPTYTFRTVKLLRYVSTMDFFVLACECIFCIFVLYYIVEEILEIKRYRLAYLKEFWNVLDIIVILISICCIAFDIYRTIAVNNKLESLLTQPNEYANFEFISYWQIIFNSALAIMAFLAWIKVFKYISFNKTMTQLSSTLGACAKDLFGFAIMFFIIFFAFAQLGYLLFGSQIADYSTYEASIFTLFRTILGDSNFVALQQANRILGPMFFILYIFFVLFVLLNMFLAIINDTYSDVKFNLEQQPNEFEMADLFKAQYGKVLAKLNYKQNRIVEIQNALRSADSNNDKQIDFEEWRHDLKMRGYAEAEIEAVFSKYDLDGDRRLDEVELKKMQADLDGQRMALKNEYNAVASGHQPPGYEQKAEMRGGALGAPLGGGVGQEEFDVLQRRVDRMEHSIGSIVSKIDAVLVKLEAMERAKAKRRETMGKLLDNINATEGATDQMKRQQMEKLVREEIERWDTEPTTAPGSGRASALNQSASPSGLGRLDASSSSA